MHKRVWIFQYPKDVKAKGSDHASWYVGWYDQSGKRHAESCGPKVTGRKKAERRQRQIQSELDMGMHQPRGKKKWSEFRKAYTAEIVPNLALRSRDQIKAALNHFERLVSPGRMESIKTQTIDMFVAARSTERGKKPGSTVSPATINKDLRHIKAALRVAVEWEYLPKMPKIRMVREPEKLVRYVTPDHFALLYRDAAALAELPLIPEEPYKPCVWWRSLLATCYMTGWRIGELLAMRTEDVDCETKTVITRHSDNKGKREELVPVHAVVIEHLTRVITDHPFVFRWPHERDKLWEEFGRIQREVGIHLTCREKHEHTPACHVYGFHDLRRAFATENAKRMKPATLQKMMRHKALKTTLGYVDLADQVQEAVDEMPVPEPLKKRLDDQEASEGK